MIKFVSDKFYSSLITMNLCGIMLLKVVRLCQLDVKLISFGCSYRNVINKKIKVIWKMYI